MTAALGVAKRRPTGHVVGRRRGVGATRPVRETMERDQDRERGIEFTGRLADIVAIIESAKARGGRDALEKHAAKVLQGATEAEVREAAEVAAEIIESIPVFLARARQEARERGLDAVAGPLLEQAERYFVRPVDLMPEMTQGLPGLLDDAYLVIRTLQNLDRGREPFLDWDLDYPERFLRRLIGAEVAQRLDQISLNAMREVSAHLSEMWSRLSHPA
jgi:uncharacterized membrane protein YkvA (DUF1232 family)